MSDEITEEEWQRYFEWQISRRRCWNCRAPAVGYTNLDPTGIGFCDSHRPVGEELESSTEWSLLEDE